MTATQGGATGPFMPCPFCGEDVYPDSKLETYRKALESASYQCGNVIFNCEQRPADNDRHLQSWRGVKDFLDAALKDLEVRP